MFAEHGGVAYFRRMSTILITGAYRGLGLATAKMLSGRGHRVIVTARDEGLAAKAGKEARVEHLVLDVTSESSIAAAVMELERRMGALDALINNAAVLLDGKIAPLDLTGDVMRRTFEVNSIAPLRVAQAFLPLLKKSGSPRMVNVSSVCGQMGSEVSAWAVAYSASKSALNMITRHLAATLPGVAVNSVCPGWCKTEMGGEQAPRTVEEGADTIAWLASESPHDLTGSFFRDRKVIAW